MKAIETRYLGPPNVLPGITTSGGNDISPNDNRSREVYHRQKTIYEFR
jgi:hypothetical protein